MRDSWIVRVLVSVIVGAAAYAIDAWLSKGGASVLTAVIVAATLAYLGHDPINASGSGSGLVQFQVRQIDGPFVAGGMWTADCVPYPFAPGDVMWKGFSKTGGYEADGPDAAFWIGWFSRAHLVLPAGRYRVGITGAAVMSEEFDLDGSGAHLQDLELPEADAGPSKPLPHYVLFAPLSTVQGQVDWLLAAPYLQTFGLTAGAYVEHAKLATRVTLIGSGPDAPGAAVEQALAAAGCRVERIEGESEDIAAELAQRIQTGQP